MRQELARMELEGVVFLKHEVQYRSLCGKSKIGDDT